MSDDELTIPTPVHTRNGRAWRWDYFTTHEEAYLYCVFRYNQGYRVENPIPTEAVPTLDLEHGQYNGVLWVVHWRAFGPDA